MWKVLQCKEVHSLITREVTLERSHMSVVNEGSSSVQEVHSLITREVTLERSHMSVLNVEEVGQWALVIQAALDYHQQLANILQMLQRKMLMR
ncbi:hypothetical protein QTO34_020247 [Cnephaeus nilssonii]|uniref:Uncharacterized protein n=1 Tax=Cnephaeus nilssonii TaxID=3371016 RepID=A0AA40H9T5_CNENI|nr:hypothetical protein QTO34_020247 [Eptesicus nilssonii]